MMAVTATATKRVRTDVVHQLKLRDAKLFVQSFNRPNLKFEVIPKVAGRNMTSLTQISEMITQRFPRKSGIIYCLSRKDCELVADFLEKKRHQAKAYHAGFTDTKRGQIQTDWIDNKTHIICATIAFGMGIDKADVRFVVHYSIPKSIEGYYQEAGRAGRDGLPAFCFLYYSGQDICRLRKIMELSMSELTFDH